MAVPYRRLSAYYFFYFAILGSIVPYWSLYLKHVGFDAQQIGQLTAILLGTKIIAPNFWGWLADHSGKRLRLVRLCTLCSSLLFAGFLYARGFQHYALVTGFFSFFWNASLPQFEVATLSHLKNLSHRYSRIRSWGSIGFIVAVLGIGRFLENFEISWLPHIILGLFAINLLVALMTPEVPFNPAHADTGSVWQILKRPEVAAFFIVYMLLQVSHGPYYVFYSVYLSQYGYSAEKIGWLWSLGVCSEILLFLMISRVQTVFSLRNMLLICLCLSCLRWWLIAYAVNDLRVIVFSQLLHAASFGLAHVVAIRSIALYFGEKHQGKGQAFYTSLSFGIGGMLGSLYSGQYWESLGGQCVYLIAALTCGLALLIAFICIGKPAATPAR